MWYIFSNDWFLNLVGGTSGTSKFTSEGVSINILLKLPQKGLVFTHASQLNLVLEYDFWWSCYEQMDECGRFHLLWSVSYNFRTTVS